MKVLLINGSSNQKGCTFTALKKVSESLNSEGIETEIFQIGNAELRDCCGCGGCRKGEPRCIFDDIANDLIEKASNCDGFVFGSPVYYAHPSGRLMSLMDRAFFAGGQNFAFKPAAAVVSARRAGTTASIDVIMKHFTINNMPIVSSSYWNMVHGNTPEEVIQDQEGLQIMRQLGSNMAWLLKSLEAGKQNGISAPLLEQKVWTNFIR